MRFSDGLGAVSIPEFLEFFSTPTPVRTAKAASAAVRMSLDLLQLQDGSDEEGDDDHDSVLGEEIDSGGISEVSAWAICLVHSAVLTGTVHQAKRPELVSNRSHRTDKLESGVARLLAMWPLVDGELEKAFVLLGEDGEGTLVTTDIFRVSPDH